MEDFNSLVVAKNNLMTSLGPNFSAYLKCMKKWFRMEYTKIEFDNRVTKLMTQQQVELHNNLLIELFRVCIGLSERSPSPTCKTSVDKSERHANKKQRTSSSRQYSSTFQVVNVLDYVSDDSMSSCEREMPETLYLPQTGMQSVLDEDVIFGRLATAAWENELDFAQKEAVYLLTTATKNLVKNILTAVLSHRKGYKVRDDSFIYNIGSPIVNPWFNATTQQYGPRYWNDPYYYGLFKRTPEESEAAREKPVTATSHLNTKKETDAEALEALNKELYEGLKKERFIQNSVSATTRVNCNWSRSTNRQKISLPELYNVLRVNRNLLLSYHVYFQSMETIIGNINHHSYDDIE